MKYNIYFAARYLSLLPPDDETAADGEGVEFQLSYRESVELVVNAAKEYFNSAASLMDTDMDLARYF